MVSGDDSTFFSQTAESDLWSGSVGMGSGEAEASPLSPATTPGFSCPATPCQDLDLAELGSSAAVSVLGAPDENEFLALVPSSQSDILDEETQQRRDARSEGDGRNTGNTAPHKQDDAEGLVNAMSGTVNALSDKEEETIRSLDKDPSPLPSEARSSDQIDTHGDEFDSYSARPEGSGRRPRPAKRKRPSIAVNRRVPA
jgi:hypothetical protein